VRGAGKTTDVSSAMDLGVGVGGGASSITEGSAVEGRARAGGVHGREQFAGEGAVRGARAGGAVRGAGRAGCGEEGGRRARRRASWARLAGGVVRGAGVRDARRKEEDARSGGHHDRAWRRAS
jgi:hypothetical protein